MMDKLKEYLTTVVLLASTAGVVLGGLAYFAKASELEALREEVVLTQVRLDQKIVGDQAFIVRQQMYTLEERNIKYGSDCAQWPDERDRKQYKELRVEQEELKAKQNKMRAPPTGTRIQ
jgi:hypothetical protein